MAIDFVIDYECVPKHQYGTQGIVDRLKARARAHEVIRLFRENGDQRPPSEMGFEFTRTAANGEEETRVIVVQEMLDQADQLNPFASFCRVCPANASGQPYGCVGTIQYPISSVAEAWLLERLPSIETPLIWLLLRQGVQEMGYDGASATSIRSNNAIFEEQRLRGRDLVEFIFNANQVFEMLFLLGDIQPVQAAMLLLFFNAVPRDFEADQLVRIMNREITAEEIDRDFPFTLQHEADDDKTISQFKEFFAAVHLAWKLGKPIHLDV